ncbi:AI-2E family transporter [Acetobacter sp. UBA5411]|uniref:AI-2E family transporter n=1 Tax=Acetobacter sp. UBA5411 TaxID=1945905 RepID=UPI0025BC2170|nr:AI-2E family transporter [Acetobacter sp. UBA5411]
MSQSGLPPHDDDHVHLPPCPVEDITLEQRQAARRAQWKAREILALAIVAITTYTIHGFLSALAWGVVFAVATWPLYRKIQARWPRLAHGALLPALCTAGMALLFLIPMLFVGLEAANEAQNVLGLMKHARNTGVPVPVWVSRLPFGANAVVKWWNSHLSDPSAAAEFFSSFDARGLAMTKTVGSQVVHRGTLFFFSILTLFFLYKDGDTIMRECTIASRRAFGRRGELIGHQIIASIHGTVAGLVLVGVGEGIIMGVIYFLTGVPHPVLLGGATAIAAMIPFCAMIPVGLASTFLLVDGGTMAAVAVFAIGAVVIFTADHFVRPGLIGGSTQLPFLWVLLGIVGGAETWGLLGLFLGPAAMATLHLLWRNWSRERGMALPEG